MILRYSLVLVLAMGSWAWAQPAAKPTSFPPAGNELAADVRAELELGLGKLNTAITALRDQLKDQPALLRHLPDIELYATAARYPLQYHELIDPKAARKVLADGMARAAALKAGETPWLLVPGPRGYVSRIDGSVQPYLLAPPKSFDPKKKYRVDLFLHGRGENLMELNFLKGNLPVQTDKFLVHPYGRYCNANKFAGEIDTLEILDDLRNRYSIDDDRIVLTGFSMGGASVWHISVHYPDLWCAASPGAGFAETRRYLHLSDAAVEALPWYEKSLWHLYDATDYALNLSNLPLIAYAGELDKQIQSSNVMEEAMKAQGLKLERIIGPKTEHKYEPEAKKELDRRLDELAAKGRNPNPEQVHFVTYTLRYNRCFWVTIDGLEHHWQEARVDAARSGNAITIKTRNISALSIENPARLPVTVDGQSFPARSIRFAKGKNGWASGARDENLLRKRHGLQGPIDDAFMDSFVIVKPSGHSASRQVDAWVQSECDKAIADWHGVFRGEARVKMDKDVTAADIAASNLVLWGDEASNAIIAQIAAKLPVKMGDGRIECNGKTFDLSHHVPVLIYPNPINPARYVVLNSGFTFHDHSSNSKQIPKLPDYAVVDINGPRTVNINGAVMQAGFLDEGWGFQTHDGR
jgi:pimeloyl-ACP methyl ester carboxylesterase